MEFVKIYDDEDANKILSFLLDKNYEYHKPYMRFGKMVKVPRGQASYTLNENIHYDYGVSGGSPVNEVMCDKLKEITQRVNKKLGTNYNTILMNVYKDGKDCIGAHKDKELGWVEGTGFATLAFGATRKFNIVKDENEILTSIPHKSGWVINMPNPLNQSHTHAVPSQPRVKEARVSLTFREIISSLVA